LAGKGFKEVYNLKGGIAHWQGLETTGPYDIGMSIVTGKETPQEIIALAYGMEHGLGELYLAMAEILDDSDVVNLFTQLADMEELHKDKLFDLYLAIDPKKSDRQIFEKHTLSDIMEGGFTTGEFLEKNKNIMKNVTDVLNIAMMIETRSLDLYLRYAQKVEDENSKTMLYDIAEEEKVHLHALGQLMDAKIQ